jgi:hypothetical protein
LHALTIERFIQLPFKINLALQVVTGIHSAVVAPARFLKFIGVHRGLHEKCAKLLVGGILKFAAIIQEEAFESLDAPVRIVGALDTPVPYSPPLEDFYLPSEQQVERAARLLVAY